MLAQQPLYLQAADVLLAYLLDLLNTYNCSCKRRKCICARITTSLAAGLEDHASKLQMYLVIAYISIHTNAVAHASCRCGL